jgi:Bacterial Ig-like domain (group 3)
MKLNLRSAVSGAAVLAIAGGILAATAGTAFAAGPTWEPDPNALGSLTLYNSSGQVVTGGSNLDHLFDYAEASTADPDGPSLKATLDFANPAPGVPTGSWFVGQGSLSTTYPNTSAPAPLNTATNPVVTVASTQGNLAAFIPTATANTEAGYENVYQLRLETSGGTGGGTGNATYWEVDIQVNPTAGTWQEIYPTAGQISTATTVSATPNPVNANTSTTLTATETPATNGSVQFENGTTPIGSPVSVSGGVATLPYTPTTAGTETINAVFTPTDTTDYASSTGSTSLTVNPPATPTTTSLSVSYTNTSAPVSVSSTVEGPGTTPNDSGTVSWYDNGSTTPLNSSPVAPNASGVATDSFTLGAGGHSIVAVFTPTSSATYDTSSSAPQSFTLQAPVTGACAQTGSQCTAVANIEATVPVGTLVISSPYTPTSPLNIGNLSLNSTLTEYTGTASFTNLTVVDTRAGDLPYTITALASNLTDGGSNLGSTICGQNVGLSGLSNVAGAGFAGTVTLSTTIGASSPPVAPTSPGACPTTAGGLVGAGDTPVTVASVTSGLGTDSIQGNLTLNAPVSTEPGVFTGTITFTVG